VLVIVVWASIAGVAGLLIGVLAAVFAIDPVASYRRGLERGYRKCQDEHAPLSEGEES
jgi:predicted PurR-regulated permease PerM